MLSGSASYEPVTVNGLAKEADIVIGDDGAIVTVGGWPVLDGMTRLLERANLTTDLDCAWHALMRVNSFIPAPANLLTDDDPRLDDERLMLNGSVTNASVAADAGIQQHKLNLNGLIPPNYLLDPVNVTVGTVPDQPVTTGGIPDEQVTTQIGNEQQENEPVFVPPEYVSGDDDGVVTTGYFNPALHFFAARGDLVERIIHKGAVNGYCPLDVNARMPMAFYPGTAPTGSVSSVGLSLPDDFIVSPDVIEGGAGVFSVSWANAPAFSWFGVGIGLDPSSEPKFHTDQFPGTLIPGLDASKVTSGTFDLLVLPFAGMGAGPGILPDPGATGSPTDYVARDMTYKTMRPPPAYEPMVPNPSITFLYWSGTQAAIQITDTLAGASLFYRVDFTGQFIPVPTGAFFIDSGVTVEAYAASTGYQASHIVSLVIPGHTP